MKQFTEKDELFHEEEDKREIVDDDNYEGPDHKQNDTDMASKFITFRDAAEGTGTPAPQVKIHRNKKFENLAAQAQEDRERELKDMRLKAR